MVVSLLPISPLGHAWEAWVRILGVLFIVFGIVVLAYGGLSYTKSRHTTDVGPVEVSTKKKGFITPAAGAAAVVVGLVLVVADRRGRLV
jgi:hypothetical protein